jgi:arylsulfatase
MQTSIIALHICLAACATQIAFPRDRPNIVLIMADDMGYSDPGCFGGEINTPNLDRLAAGGLRYTDFHNAARCCPTRASLLTGLYPHQAGVGHMVYENLGTGYLGRLNGQCTTLAEVLARAGYQTMMAGKWHVGHQQMSVLPEQRGFHRFYGTYLHVDSYFKVLPSCDIYLNGDKQIPGSWQDIPLYPGRPDREFYTTDVYTDFALQFLDGAYGKDRPFFLYLAYNAPHWPLEAPAQNIEKYKDCYDTGWDQLRQDKFTRMKQMGIVPANAVLPETGNPLWSELPEADHRELAFRRAIYAAQIDRMDENIGRVVDSLDQAGEFDNTLILFLSDNGCSAEAGMFGYNFTKNRISNYDQWRTASGRSVSQGQCWANASNVPYRKYKKYTHEGGTRTPLIAHWPAGIGTPTETPVESNAPAADVTGRLIHDAGHIIDIMATVCELAGAERPVGTRGVSLVPTFRGDALKGRDAIYWEHEGHRAIRVGDWKLVSTREGGNYGSWELYNLVQDPTECQDRAGAASERVRQLETKWTSWAREANVLPDQFERRRARAKPKSRPKGNSQSR